MSETQAVTFASSQWTPAMARLWLSAHDYVPIKRVHRTAHRLRYRIRDPGMFSRYITKNIGGGIELVIGFK